jgi:hypothetical protein
VVEEKWGEEEGDGGVRREKGEARVSGRRRKE